MEASSAARASTICRAVSGLWGRVGEADCELEDAEALLVVEGHVFKAGLVDVEADADAAAEPDMLSKYRNDKKLDVANLMRRRYLRTLRCVGNSRKLPKQFKRENRGAESSFVMRGSFRFANISSSASQLFQKIAMGEDLDALWYCVSILIASL